MSDSEKAPPAPNNGGAREGKPFPAPPLLGAGGAALNAHQLSKERQRAAKRVAILEAEVETLEGRLAQIEAGLSAPASADAALALAREHAEVQEALTARMTDWEAATLEAETLGAL